MEARLPDQQAEDRLRSVIVQLPPRLQCQHSTGLAKLTPEGWRLAEVAAVMPQPFVCEVVAQVMGEPVADLVPALREALSAGVIVPTASALTFRHDGVRQAMYERVPAPIRLALLRRVERLGPEIGSGRAGEAQEAGEAQDSSLVDCEMADRHVAGRSNYAARPATPTPATSANLAESETGISVSGPVVGWAVPGDLAVARAQAETILGDAHGPGIDGNLAAALSTLGFIAWNEGRVADALSYQRASVSRALRNGSLTAGLRPRFGLAAVCTAVGDAGQADNAILAIEATARMLGETGWLAAAPILRARLSTVMGSPGAAAAEASTALELEEQHGPTIFSAAAFLVMAAEALNSAGLADATMWLDRLADQPSGARAVLGQASVLWVEARLAGARFGAAAAHEAMGPVYEAPVNHVRLLLEQPLSTAWLVRTALEAGDTTGAERVTACAEQLAAANAGFPLVAGPADHARALLDQDAPALERLGKELRCSSGRATAREDAGDLLARSGQRGQARAQFERALAGFEQMEASLDEARVRARLVELGPGRRRACHGARAVSGWESLTDAERRVVDPVALGLSNAQAASQLYLSRHTVDFHLRQIFRKLNIGSRVELARLSLEHQRKALVTDNGVCGVRYRVPD
jgi:DNA-binding CsgD family transcriptional regulator